MPMSPTAQQAEFGGYLRDGMVTYKGNMFTPSWQADSILTVKYY